MAQIASFLYPHRVLLFFLIAPQTLPFLLLALALALALAFTFTITFRLSHYLHFFLRFMDSIIFDSRAKAYCLRFGRSLLFGFSGGEL